MRRRESVTIAVVSSSGGARLLIATGAAAASAGDVPAEIRALIGQAGAILVMTPKLVGPLDWYSDVAERAEHDADDRLATVLSQVEAIARSATPESVVGDEGPLTAFGDAIATFRPDHIVIALRGEDQSSWQERHLIDRVRERFHIPITVFELDRSGHVPTPAAE